jgi:hypothetical protein
MADRKPLVLGDDVSLQQLQPQDDLDIPLSRRVIVLEMKFRKLLQAFVLVGGQSIPPGLEDDFMRSLGE